MKDERRKMKGKTKGKGRSVVQKTQTPLPVVGQRRLIDSLVVPQVAGRP